MLPKAQALGLLLAAVAVGAHAQTSAAADAEAARCAELAAQQKATFQKRLQAMAPSVSPTTHVDSKTDVRELISTPAGGGMFSGFNIGAYVSGLAGQYFQKTAGNASNTFLGGINSVLSKFNTPGFNLGSSSLATPSFNPVQSAMPGSTSPSAAAAPATQRSPYSR